MDVKALNGSESLEQRMRVDWAILGKVFLPNQSTCTFSQEDMGPSEDFLQGVCMQVSFYKNESF